MTTTHAQSGYATFRPRARLLKLIGAELISDDVVAVTELVKNAHDADASRVIIRFERVTQPGGRIIVSDDGHGMDRDTLLGRWMEPAGSTKRGRERKLSPKGRWMLGEKGIGRFAADKLGQTLELLSRREGSAAEVRAEFDWDLFDTEGAMLGDVENRWEIRPARELQAPGTVLHIGGLRSRWTERMFRRLSIRLARLRSPFQDQDSFSIRIESDEFPEYSRELSSGFLDVAPYRLEAHFNGRDGCELRFNGEKKRFVPWSGPALSCGPLRVRLNAFDLETEAIARVGPRMEVRAWLKEWSGISVYRDGFRVWPYGEPHDDWLRLDQRRVNNPVVCLSNNQVVGFVEISQKDNSELRDQTNREGLIHTQAFDDLRRLMHHLLQQLEAERQSVRHPEGRNHRLDQRRVSPAAGAGNAELEKLRILSEKVGGRLGSEVRGVTSRLEEQWQRLEGEKGRLVQSYASLAARGHVIAGFGPEAADAVQDIHETLRQLRASSSSGSALAGSLKKLDDEVSRLEARLQLIGAVSEGVHRRRSIEVPVEVMSAASLLCKRLEPRGITMRVEADKGSLLRADMSPSSLHLVLQILTANSIEWLAKVEHPCINVSVSGRGDHIEILFADSGPGFGPDVAERIFEPHFSLKESGHGMGLTIARNIMAAHGGTIQAIVDRRRKGATFLLTLPRRRARAT